ncbi:tlde1 domain-containing protein [Paraburkholderia bryophila]|uniref:tlde1 domain-containing protein n=1 Tax=Paraburkholderia bryophila TaxID=420952 RepID=UPI0023EA6215|nr:tlde1 domain-containing protein [Paraburkholderia bryophila]
MHGVRRGNFRLHPDGRFGINEGCIAIQSPARFDQLRAYLMAQDAKAIPGTNIRYFGTVDVR